MAGEAAPTDYYPNQGSFAERYMRTRDAARYPNEGSKAYEGGDSGPPVPAASYSSWWADDLVLSNGAAVSSWTPRNDGLSAGNLTQGTGSKQPNYRSASGTMGGRPSVEFDGVDDTMKSSAFASAVTNGTVVIVGNSDDGESGTTNFFDGVSSSDRWILGAKPDNIWAIYQGDSSPESAAGTRDTAQHLFYVTFDTTDTLDVDGTEIISDAAGTGSFGGLSLCARFDGGQPLEGNVSFIMVVDGYLTATEKTALETWVTDTYGITIS
jgi:hypothetical protein